jgi:hypothetical protein
MGKKSQPLNGEAKFVSVTCGGQVFVPKERLEELEAERDRLRELVERTVAHADRMHLILPPEMVREFRAALEGR